MIAAKKTKAHCVLYARLSHFNYSLTNVSRGLYCHLIYQVPIFLKLVAAPLNQATKSVYNTRIRRNHVPLLNK